MRIRKLNMPAHWAIGTERTTLVRIYLEGPMVENPSQDQQY